MFRPVIILSGIILSSSVLAATVSDTVPASQYVIGLSPGLNWVSGNKTQTLNLEPDVQKTYTANNNSPSVASGELFIGMQKLLPVHPMQHNLIGQVGIVVAGVGDTKLKGNIWEDADPAFNNFTYNYKVQHTHVAIKGRLIGNCGWIFEPYVSGSIGVGFNRAYDFTVNPIVSSAVSAPLFGSNTTTTFVYTLGIGLQKSFNTHLQAALGYEFADWGKTQLSRATGQTLNHGLTQNHLYANQIQLSLYYIF
ncbi:MAG: porin family protein [Gammaproteobacteria bacterium]|nr:porin family protein [Gammaproteobacteria bacterium]